MNPKFYSVIILLAGILLPGEDTNAQSWLWAKSMGGPYYDDVRSMTIDPESGDIYTIGSFGGMFISKQDSSGNFEWTRELNCSGTSIAFDPSNEGGVYFTGLFSGTVDFDPGAGVYNLTANGSGDIFISKLDASGDFVWAKSIGGIAFDRGLSVAFDPAGSGALYTTGDFSGTIDFDPGDGVYNLTGSFFISKLDGSGNFVWAKAMNGGTGLTIALDLSENGGVYTTGPFTGTVDFDPGVGIFNLTSTEGDPWDLSDIFISKLDNSGNFEWAKAIGGPDTDSGLSVAVDLPGTSGDVYITGGFQGSVDFDPGDATFTLIDDGLFILKLDRLGNFVWAKSMDGGAYPGQDRSIALDPSGSGAVYTTGHFYGETDFNPGEGTFMLYSVGVWDPEYGYGSSADIFISKLDSSGNFAGAIAAGGTGNDVGVSIAVDASGIMHIAGYFVSPSISFDSTTLTDQGSGDIFIAKLDGLGPLCNSVVTNVSDSGGGSLRDIISCSTSNSTITFALAPMSQIILTSGEIVINKDLTLSGFEMLDLIISGNNASRIFHVLPGKSLEIENMSLKNATSVTNGGAVYIEGSLTLENVVLENNFENGIPKGLTMINPGVLNVIGNVEIKD